MKDGEDEVLAVLAASAPRRWLGIGMLAGLGALLLWVAVAAPPELAFQALLIALGLGALALAVQMHAATQHRIELTATELRDSSGRRLALVGEIAGMDRGMFAFKPSNGFTLRLHRAEPLAWRPGLWWRIGRRLGVGGVTPGRQTKFMSEMLAAILAERD